MKATTIKIEGELLRKLEQVKPPGTSVSAFVRGILRKDLQRRKLAESAVAYEEFVASNAEEQSWLREWDEADLAAPPKRGGR
jgi:predicted CopG family antitoxin